MRKPSLSFDAFSAALAVLGASASLGCSRGATPGAVAEPAAAATAAPTPPAAGAEGAAAVAPPTPPPSPAAAHGSLEDAPSPKKPSGSVSESQKPGPPKDAPRAPVQATPTGRGPGRAVTDAGQMTCGAANCSSDMKKGSGN